MAQLTQEKRDLLTEHNQHTWAWGTSAEYSQGGGQEAKVPRAFVEPCSQAVHCSVPPHPHLSVDQPAAILKLAAIFIRNPNADPASSTRSTDDRSTLPSLLFNCVVTFYFCLVCMPLKLKEPSHDFNRLFQSRNLIWDAKGYTFKVILIAFHYLQIFHYCADHRLK